MVLCEELFSESYKHELAKNYNEAIAPLMKIYSEGNYELNLRLGWLYYNSKSYAVAETYYQKAVNLNRKR
jgi:tetratricopeptide (TPR) repeat protein